MHNAAAFGGMFGTVPWLAQIIRLVPLSWTPMGRMLLYSEQCVDERKVRLKAFVVFTLL